MSHQDPLRLLGPNDPPAFLAQNQGAGSPYMFVCDHAGRRVPQCLDSLGLAEDHFERHIAWDIGAGSLAMALGKALNAFCIRQTYSRLVIDCNRTPAHADMFVHQADGAEVPGNAALTDADMAARTAEIYTPYHAAIAAEIDARLAQRRPPALVSVHSFTPVFKDMARPWHVGVLHDGASASSARMLALLAAEPDLVVGDNEPYAMDGIDFTIPHHAIARGLPYLELEVRQDLIADRAGVARFAALLRRLIPAAFAQA